LLIPVNAVTDGQSWSCGRQATLDAATQSCTACSDGTAKPSTGNQSCTACAQLESICTCPFDKLSEANQEACARCVPKKCDEVDAAAKAKLKAILFWVAIGMFVLSGVLLVGVLVHFILWTRWRHGILAKIEKANMSSAAYFGSPVANPMQNTAMARRRSSIVD
jgi:hypothetical protein